MKTWPTRRKLRRLLRWPVLAALLWQSATHAQDTPSPGEATCFGTFFNPITDVCWQCIFPISIGSIAFDNGQEDIENPANPICICPIPIPPYFRIGLEVGFWEPARTLEVTRTSFCFPSLGGYYMDGGRYAPPGGQDHTAHDKVNKGSFYQVHYYINPILYYLEVLLDDQCLESGAYDLAYMTEYDVAWHSDELTAILEPEAPLFSNIIAIASCSADCVAASVGFGIKEMFWCSGCNGPTYPMNGNVPVHIGGVQASSLLAHRMLAKMHRQLIAKQWHGESAVCESQYAPLMDKTGYKIQMVYPIPVTSGTDGTGEDRCCQPLGRTTQIWGMGKEYPIRGEDFTYQVFRKRNCCMSY